MTEIDLRSNQGFGGIRTEDQLISIEIYRLLTIFAGSPKIAALQESAEGGCVYSWSVRSFEYPEIGRILVTLAAILRNGWDSNPKRIRSEMPTWDSLASVGLLIPNLNRPSESEPLSFRESLHKILHASAMNLDRSEGPSIYDGHLNPRVHLYGEKQASNWKATLEIYDWAKMVHTLS